MKTSRLFPLLPCAASLFCLGQSAHAGSWQLTYQCQGSSQEDRVGSPAYPQRTSSTNNPWSNTPQSDGSLELDGGGIIRNLSSASANDTGTVTATLTWVSTNGDAPTGTTLTVCEDGSVLAAYDYYPYSFADAPCDATADDGLGDPAVEITGESLDGKTSSGKHLLTLPIVASGGTYTVTLPQRTFTASGSISDTTDNAGFPNHNYIDMFINYNVVQNSREVTLHRGNARGETQDPDGTVHGDTIYSYLEYDNNGPDNSLEQTGDNLNVQTFYPTFYGSWNLQQYSPYTWTPEDSEDTGSVGGVSMHYRNYSTLEGDPEGQDTPEQRTITYSTTDTDGASATANYILTVHDPNELGADTVTHGIENLRTAPNASYVRATQDDSTLTVYAEQADSWTLGISADIPWVVPDLGLNASASYSYSYNAGVQASIQHVPAGYATCMQEFDAYKYHTGTITQWDAGGYVGTTTYHVKEPDSPCGGYQALYPPVYLPDNGMH